MTASRVTITPAPAATRRGPASGTSEEEIIAMTGQLPGADRIPRPAPLREPPQVAPGRAGERPARQCRRCGALSTHYLTCPSLRLPQDCRLSGDAEPDRAGYRGQEGIAGQPSLVSGRYPNGPAGGPGHPDWPRPPQQ